MENIDWEKVLSEYEERINSGEEILISGEEEDSELEDLTPRLDFKKRKVFDSSAGWGGRLLGALSSKYPIHYVGLDVNKSNDGCYEALGDFYNSKWK